VSPVSERIWGDHPREKAAAFLDQPLAFGDPLPQFIGRVREHDALPGSLEEGPVLCHAKRPCRSRFLVKGVKAARSYTQDCL
jgi:hypothetical protein